MSIDKAASAFDAAMGNTSGGSDDSEVNTMGVEELFPSRSTETDITAGGDEEPLKGVDDGGGEPKPAKSGKAAQRAVEGDPSEDDILYGDEPDPKKPEGEEEDEEGEKEEGDDPDEDADVAEIDPDTVVEVVVDGKPKKVTFKEATEGYIRTDTFHQRLNMLDDTKKVLQQEAGVLLEDRKKAVAQLAEIEETAKALLPKEPDWDTLFAEDPKKARKLQQDFEAYKKTLDDLKAKREQTQLEAQKLSESELIKFAKTERQKFEDANPHWKSDETKKAKDLAAMIRTARAHKFSDEEIAQTLDSRMLGILLKASKYDRMMAAKPKANPRGQTPVKPGAGKTRTAPKGIARSQAQLSKTGHVEDAAAVFQQLIASS